MTSFRRTGEGQANAALFYNCPIVWVEGSSDIPFYAAALSGVPCNVKSAGGVEEAEKLAQRVLRLNAPHVVVQDAHYRLLGPGTRKRHARVILLERHSAENYFAEADVFTAVCCKYCKDNGLDCTTGFNDACRHLEESLQELVTLDIAHAHAATGRSVLPPHIEPLLARPNCPRLDSAEIGRICSAARPCVTDSAYVDARTRVASFLRRRPFTHIVPGHIVFGFFRCGVLALTRARTRRTPKADVESFRLVLCDTLRSTKPSKDYQRLLTSLRMAIEDARLELARQRPVAC